jgi:hydrogenase maturation protease
VRYLIGVGNYMASDDAVGLRIVEEIAAQGLEDGFRAVDLSSNSLNLVCYLVPETEAILVVDSARMGLQPGDVRFFAPDEVETNKALAGISTHEDDLMKVLELARAAGCTVPRLRIMGIEPEKVDAGPGLSRTIEDRTDGYVAAAIAGLMSM